MAKKGKASKNQGKAHTPQQEAAAPANQPAAEARLVRAIRVSPKLLEAAKAYKKDKGVSFYRLGEEAITERLTREGYLKADEAKAGK